jgi:hypothetical protein
MTLENQNIGAEFGIEKKSIFDGAWYPINKPGDGYETYGETYQTALAIHKVLEPGKYRVVVYDYDGSKRKNIRILTAVTPLEPRIEKAVDEMIDIAPTGEDEGSEYGIESRLPYLEWSPITKPGSGFKTYKKAYQNALEIAKKVYKTYLCDTEFRVVVYDYDGSKRKNIRGVMRVTKDGAEK